MRILSKDSIKRKDRVLNENIVNKHNRNDKRLSLGLLVNEGGKLVLYSIPSQNINNLDNKKGIPTMNNIKANPLKITNFYISGQLTRSSVPWKKGNLLVYIMYFDENIDEYYNYHSVSSDTSKMNPKKYNSNNSPKNSDRSCIVIDVLASNKDLQK